jgi:L-fuculose-phosphate aldolase
MKLASSRRELLAHARAMSAAGLTPGTSGNLSVRVAGGFLITPTGVPYETMRPGDLVELAADGTVRPRQKEPSSEWRLHRDVYARRPDVGAIVHTHSTFATVIACLRQPVRAVHYALAFAGVAEVPCAPYSTYGTQELSQAAVSTLGSGHACLLANHGLIAVGPRLAHALRVAREVEWVAEVSWRASQAGEPVVLDPTEMARVVEKFRTYGQTPRRRSRSRPISKRPAPRYR